MGLNMKKDSIFTMKKSGQLIELAGMLVILGIAIFGTTTVYFQKDSVYIADKTNMGLYNYSECKEFISTLQKDRLVAYDCKEKAEEEGFHLKSCTQ